MNILFVTGELFPWKNGGPQVVVYHLVNKLIKKGVNVHIFANSNRKMWEIYNHYDSRITFSLARKFSREGEINIQDLMFSQVKFSKEFIEKGRKFDIIHFQILPAAKAILLPFVSKLWNKKCILTLHDWPPMEYKFYGKKLGRDIHWLFSRLNFSFIDYIVVNSRFMKKLAQKTNIGNSITIIPNGVDHKQWKTEGKAKLVGEVNAFFWGKLWPKKGVDILIKSFSRILPLTKTNVHLYIAGLGPWMQEYQKLTRQLNIDEKVHFLGFLPHEELVKYISAADFCVLPSRWEGFGIAVLEAMCCKKLVVATNIGGVADIVNDGHDGILVAPASIKKLAQTMLYIIKRRNSNEIKRIAENAYETTKRFDWTEIADRYIEVYESLLEERCVRTK